MKQEKPKGLYLSKLTGIWLFIGNSTLCHSIETRKLWCARESKAAAAHWGIFATWIPKPKQI